MIFGTLDTGIDTTQLTAESGAGIKMAMLEMSWNNMEPTQGTFSASCISEMQSWLAAYQAAGMQVTLATGLSAPPPWVAALNNAHYVDQHGTTDNTESNFVFSQAVRSAAATYLAKVAQIMPLSNFYAIRLTSGGDGEILYPGGGGYWGFNPSALTGTGLPAGMTVNPFPSWHPGTSGLTSTQIGQWVDWYVSGLVNVTTWQIAQYAALGFTGYYQTVTPGDGVRPSWLNGTLIPGHLPDDDTACAGAFWDKFYTQLRAATSASIMAHCSSTADQSGSPANNLATSADASKSLTDSSADNWSAARWIARCAQGYPLSGENPGYDMPPTFDTWYTDTSLTGMMSTALNMAVAGNFAAFYWAHDARLWETPGVPLSVYASKIAALPVRAPQRTRNPAAMIRASYY